MKMEDWSVEKINVPRAFTTKVILATLFIYAPYKQTNKQEYLLEKLEGGAIGILQQWVM